MNLTNKKGNSIQMLVYFSNMQYFYIYFRSKFQQKLTIEKANIAEKILLEESRIKQRQKQQVYINLIWL